MITGGGGPLLWQAAAVQQERRFRAATKAVAWRRASPWNMAWPESLNSHIGPPRCMESPEAWLTSTAEVQPIIKRLALALEVQFVILCGLSYPGSCFHF